MVTRIIQALATGIKRYGKTLCIVFAGAGIGSYLYYNYNIQDIATTQRILVGKVAQNRTQRILELVKRQTTYSQMLIRSDAVINALIHYGSEKQDEYFKTLWLFLEEAGTAENYQTTLLMNTQGKVIFSNLSDKYVGVDLLKLPGSDSPLGKTVARVIMTVTHDYSSFLPDPVLGKPAIYIVTPVFKDGVFLGILAQQLNSLSIYSVLHDYISLGISGEVQAGIRSNNGVLFITQSKEMGLDPFKRFISDDDLDLTTTESLLLSALNGKTSQAIFDEKNSPTAFGWQYVPFVDWGIVVAQPLAEYTVHYVLFLYLALLCGASVLFLLVYFLVSMQWFKRSCDSLRLLWGKPGIRTGVGILLLVAVLMIFVLVLYLFMRGREAQIKQVKSQAQKITHASKARIQRAIDQIEGVGYALAYGLNTGLIQYDDIIKRLERDLKDNPLLYGITVAFQPYKFSADKRLYAPYVIRSGDTFILQRYDEIYDYSKAEVAMASSWSWFTKPMQENKLLWWDPYWEEIAGKSHLLSSYSLPFYAVGDTEHREPVGIINVALDFSNIQQYVTHITLGNSGYGMLLSPEGTLLYYPQEDYVSGHKTILDLARQSGNEELFAIGEKLLAGNSGFFEYRVASDTNPQRVLYATQLSESTKWILATVFSGSEMGQSVMQIRHYSIVWLLILMVFIILLDWLIAKHFWNVKHIANLLTAVFAVGLITLLVIIRLTPLFQVAPDSVVVVDQTHINKYIQVEREYAKSIGEVEPVPLYFGMYITSIRFPSSTTIDLTGYLWQRVNDQKDKEILQELQFVQAVQAVKFVKIYEKEEGDTTLICWRFFARIAQQFNYAQYPFDAVNVSVELEHNDYARNVILVPMLDMYSSQQHKHPALSATVNLSGFDVHRTFFAFNSIQKPLRFGMSAVDGPYQVQTIYNITMTRSLLYDFIVFVLPLLIIYFLLYTILIITTGTKKTRELSTLSAYTGLVFVAILLHRALRDQYQTGGILYIEYLFFLVYVSFIIIVLYTSIDLEKDSRAKRIVTRIFLFFKDYFWPIQLSSLFIITLMTFFYS